MCIFLCAEDMIRGVPSNLPQVFGRVLRTHRERKGLNQMNLAADAGLHLNAIGNLERGISNPNLQTLFLISKALGVPAAELVADVERRKPRVE